MTHSSSWRQDPEGNEYRINLDDGTVEYKKPPPKQAKDFKHFLVTVRGEERHIQAPDEEAAAVFFWSDSLPHLPKRNEVVVTEVVDGNAG